MFGVVLLMYLLNPVRSILITFICFMTVKAMHVERSCLVSEIKRLKTFKKLCSHLFYLFYVLVILQILYFYVSHRNVNYINYESLRGLCQNLQPYDALCEQINTFPSTHICLLWNHSSLLIWKKQLSSI